jgi:hypothetical protein
MSPCAEIIELNDKARLPNVTKPMDLNEVLLFIINIYLFVSVENIHDGVVA